MVAKAAHSAPSILFAWALGGLVALLGAFVLSELAARRPNGCGPYAYLGEAFHPIVAFAFGWTALLVSFTGGVAAAALLFAGYFTSLTGLAASPTVVAIGALVLITLVGCFGVRQNGNVQNALTLLKLAAIAGLLISVLVAHPAAAADAGATAVAPLGGLQGIGAAIVPVLFAYNGAVVVNFMATETKNPGRALPVGLWAGIAVSIVVYLAVNAVCLYVLGVGKLALTATPISDAVEAAVGQFGGRLVACAIALSTLSFIGNRTLTIPRLYHAMARDGLFFRQVAAVHPATRVPVAAVLLQGAVAIAMAATGSYARILDYVVFATYIFAGLSAIALVVLRTRDARTNSKLHGDFRMPWHPVSTIAVAVISFAVVADTFVHYPAESVTCLGIIAAAVPAYAVWRFARSS